MLLIQYIAMRTHLLAPNFIDLCLKYHIGTGSWLVELVKQDCPVGFPSSVNVPPVLTCIPECLVSNFCDLIAFFVQHQNATLHESTGLQHQLITFSVIFMKSHLLSNPHLRGKIAQVLSHLIPSNERRSGLLDISDIQRVVFESHSFANQHLFTSLLTIFIDIEHTGDSMEFEDKFSYRMPIYDIIKFLWEIPSYQQNLITLSKEVEKLSSSAETPLFLRFVNMMLNDATLQLDEGLKNLSKIYKIQLLKESTDWEEMSREEKGDQEEQLQEAMMYARNRNALALGTVNTLELITSQITEPFVIKAVVDQVASMLNYFLKELVSSKSKEFAVRMSL
jgi:ubiquitin conjugation factor E4 A